MQSHPLEGKEGVGETEPLVVASRFDIRTERKKRGGAERRAIRNSSTA